MTNFQVANGVDNLKKIIDGLEPNQEHPILFQLGDMRAVILADKTHATPRFYYNDLTSRPANASIKKLFLNLHDVYELTKQEIIHQTLTSGRTDHVKNADEALAEIKFNMAKNAWDVVKEPEKVSNFSMFSNRVATPATPSPGKSNRPSG